MITYLLNPANVPTITAIAALISALTALVAVFFGPMMASRASERQIRATVRSTNRQKWINELRDSIAQFLSLATYWQIHFGKGSTEFNEAAREFLFMCGKIELMLNVEKDDQKRISQLVNSISETASGKRTFDQQVAQEIDELVEVSQRVLKAEWERVKRLD